MPQGDSHFVYRIVDGKVKLTKVVTGTRREEGSRSSKGSPSVTRCVTAGQLKIRDGSAVSVVTATGA